MAKKKGKRRVKAERGTLFKNKKGSLFQNKNKDSATKKFIDGVDNSENIELTESGKEFFEGVVKQQVAQTMESPILFKSFKYQNTNEEINLLDFEPLDIEGVKYTLKDDDNIWIFKSNEAILLDMVLEKEYSFEYDFELKFIPLLHENKLYFSLNKEIRVFDIQEKKWEIFTIKGIPISGLSFFGEHFYIVTDYSKLTCYNKSFKEVWIFTTEKYLLNKPVYKDGSLFISSTDGIMYQVDAVEGELVWSFNFKSPVESSVVIFDKYIAATSMDGKVHFLCSEKRDEVFFLDTGFALLNKPIIMGEFLYIFNRTFIWRFSISDEEFSYEMINFQKSIETIYSLDEHIAIINNESSFFILDKELNLAYIPSLKLYKQPLQHMNVALLIDENNKLYKTDIG